MQLPNTHNVQGSPEFCSRRGSTAEPPCNATKHPGERLEQLPEAAGILRVCVGISPCSNPPATIRLRRFRIRFVGVEPWNSWGAKGAGRCCLPVPRPRVLWALCQRAPGGIPGGIIHKALSQLQVPKCCSRTVESLVKHWSAPEWGSPNPWECSQNPGMWHLGTWWCWLRVGLDDLKVLFQP